MISTRSRWHGLWPLAAVLSVTLAFVASGCSGGQYGFVTRTDTGKTVSGVRVEYIDPNGKKGSTVTTGIGYYVFPGKGGPSEGWVNFQLSTWWGGFGPTKQTKFVTYTKEGDKLTARVDFSLKPFLPAQKSAENLAWSTARPLGDMQLIEKREVRWPCKGELGVEYPPAGVKPGGPHCSLPGYYLVFRFPGGPWLMDFAYRTDCEGKLIVPQWWHILSGAKASPVPPAEPGVCKSGGGGGFLPTATPVATATTVPTATPTAVRTPTPPPTPQALQADLALIDLFPNQLPTGYVFARIRNNGPDTVTNFSVTLDCSVCATFKATGLTNCWSYQNPAYFGAFNPGYVAEKDTGLSIDVNIADYQVQCTMLAPAFDPNPGNNSFSKMISSGGPPPSPEPID